MLKDQHTKYTNARTRILKEGQKITNYCIKMGENSEWHGAYIYILMLALVNEYIATDFTGTVAFLKAVLSHLVI